MLIQLPFVQGREMCPVHELLEPTDVGQDVLSALNGRVPLLTLRSASTLSNGRK
jgi:hypothetical protein